MNQVLENGSNTDVSPLIGVDAVGKMACVHDVEEYEVLSYTNPAQILVSNSHIPINSLLDRITHLHTKDNLQWLINIPTCTYTW